jgi:hypothetical protein
VGSFYPTKIYINYDALLSILVKGPDSYRKVARWINKLIEYDFEVYYRPGKSNLINIVDGLS